MNLNEMTKTIKKIGKKRGWNSTDMEQIVEMIEENYEELKDQVTEKDKHGIDHKMMDVFVLLLQLAIRNDTDLETLFKAHIEEMREKYPVKENGSD
ncbi:MAG: hypothetical protein GOV02_00170 [Candidatus Aenigmarchaeota archaeon]|nr:hypothetical protein [Candidatus Aenigmarchaeota archaeon]